MSTEQDVLFSAVEAYTGLLTDLAVLELAKQNEARLGRQLEATRDRFRVGEVTRTDVAQAEARLAGAVAERIAAKGTIQTSKATYRNIINQEPVSLSPPPVLQEIPGNEAEAQDLAEGINPNILAAEYNLAAAEEDIRVATSALLPRLDLEGALRYDDDPNLGRRTGRARRRSAFSYVYRSIRVVANMPASARRSKSSTSGRAISKPQPVRFVRKPPRPGKR